MVYMTDMELRHGLIIVSIRDSFQMGVCIKEDFMRMKFKAKEYLVKKMEKNILVIG